MLRRGIVVAGMMLLICGSLRPARLHSAEPTEEAGTGAGQQSPPVTFVVFDFKVQEGTDAEVGKRIAEAVSARLAQEKDFRVLPRTEIVAGLQKEGLAAPAPGDRVAAVEAGHFLGAEWAVFGRVVTSGSASYLIAKVVSTEDLALAGVIVKAAPQEEVTLLAERAAAKLSGVLPGQHSMGWASGRPSPLFARSQSWRALLRQRVGDGTLPRVAVLMSEGHLGKQLPQSICEAAATQFLLDAGLDARSCGTTQSQQWARSLRWEANDRGRDEPGPMRGLPPETEGADLVIIGHGWSSPTPKYGAYGELVICDARVEVKVIDRATGLQVSSQNAWGMALGRTEDEAGRKALEQAGRFVAAYAGGQIEGWA